MLTLQKSDNSLSGSAWEMAVYSGNKNLHWTLLCLENNQCWRTWIWIMHLGFLLLFLALQEKLLCWARIKGHGRKSVSIWSSELLAVLVYLVSIPKRAGVCDRAKQTLLAPPSAKLSFFYIWRLIKAREDLYSSPKTQINSTIRNGIDEIRTLFFSWLTLPAVYFLNTSRQRQSPGDCCIARADLHGFSLAPCAFLCECCSICGISNSTTPLLSEPS